METTQFRDLTKTQFLFRTVYRLGNKWFVPPLILVAIGVLICLRDGSLHPIAAPPTVIVIVCSSWTLWALQFTMEELAHTIQTIEPAFVDKNQFETAIKEMVFKFPSNYLSIGLGLFAGLIVFVAIQGNTTKLVAFYQALLCLVGGQIFGFGLLGFIWSYRFIWRLRFIPIQLFFTFRLQSLSSYGFTLYFIAVIPTILMLVIYCSGGSCFHIYFNQSKCIHHNIILWGILIISLIELVTITVAEMAIVKLVSNARNNMLDKLAYNLKELWGKITLNIVAPEGSKTNKDLLEEIEKLERLRRIIVEYKSNVIDWNALISKLIVPIIIALTITFCQTKMRKEPPPSPKQANSTTMASMP